MRANQIPTAEREEAKLSKAYSKYAKANDAYFDSKAGSKKEKKYDEKRKSALLEYSFIASDENSKADRKSRKLNNNYYEIMNAYFDAEPGSKEEKKLIKKRAKAMRQLEQDANSDGENHNFIKKSCTIL